MNAIADIAIFCERAFKNGVYYSWSIVRQLRVLAKWAGFFWKEACNSSYAAFTPFLKISRKNRNIGYDCAADNNRRFTAADKTTLCYLGLPSVGQIFKFD